MTLLAAPRLWGLEAAAVHAPLRAPSAAARCGGRPAGARPCGGPKPREDDIAEVRREPGPSPPRFPAPPPAMRGPGPPLKDGAAPASGGGEGQRLPCGAGESFRAGSGPFMARFPGAHLLRAPVRGVMVTWHKWPGAQFTGESCHPAFTRVPRLHLLRDLAANCAVVTSHGGLGCIYCAIRQ